MFVLWPSSWKFFAENDEGSAGHSSPSRAAPRARPRNHVENTGKSIVRCMLRETSLPLGELSKIVDDLSRDRDLLASMGEGIPNDN